MAVQSECDVISRLTFPCFNIEWSVPRHLGWNSLGHCYLQTESVIWPPYVGNKLNESEIVQYFDAKTY